MTSNTKELLQMAMACATIVACAALLRTCDHKKFELTCDVREPKCVELWDKAAK